MNWNGVSDVYRVNTTDGCSDHILRIDTSYDNLCLGESIAIDGVCLTVCAVTETVASFALSPETLQLTRFLSLTIGSKVNVERALTLSDRLGGHFVTGHIDQVIQVIACLELDGFRCLRFFGITPEHRYYLQAKGSVALNGVSLTINTVLADGFEVMLIPETLTRTTLAMLSEGDCVHVEYDMLVKSVVCSTKQMRQEQMA